MYFEKFLEERTLSNETIKGYKSTIKKYQEYHQTSLDELIEEAIAEEDEGILMKRRTIKARLLDFRTYLLNHTELKISTINSHIGNLKTIYKQFDIELPDLPTLKNRNHSETTYLDLPTKKDIAKAIKSTGIQLGSMILIMASSGMARTECVNMTIGTFIEGCKEYYTSKHLKDIIEELYYSKEEIVPTLQIFRQKTEKMYYAFCTPQASHAVLEWLMMRVDEAEENNMELTMEDSLWGWDTRKVTYEFTKLNDDCNFGYNKDGYRFFRPHALRKFNGSNIGLSPETIDLLHGRSKNKIHETYIKTNPESLKQTYMSVMENVTIEDVSKKEIHHDEFTINVNIMMMGSEYGISI